MSAQGRSARPRPSRIIHGLLCALALQWSPSSHAEAPRARSEHRIVYRCMHENVLTLTDVPCRGETIDIDLNRNVSIAHRPTAKAREEARTPRRRVSPDTTAKQLEAQQARCQRLLRQLETLHGKLRSGYKAPEGIRLEERKRQLREQARSAKCPTT